MHLEQTVIIRNPVLGFGPASPDENGKAALFLSSFEEVEKFLKDKMTSDCVILTMGAGDIGEVARKLVD